jgi:hypothetical protein
MKAHELFVVGVRLLGVWFGAQSVIYALTFMDAALGISPLQVGVTTPYVYLLYASGNCALALILLIGAPLISALFYGDKKRRYFEDHDQDDYPEAIHREDSAPFGRTNRE